MGTPTGYVSTECQPPHSQCLKSASGRGLVETELIRKRLYEQLLVTIRLWFAHHTARSSWSRKEISHLLLRYIFVKKATRFRLTPDPVFVIGTCPAAQHLIHRDFQVKETAGASQLSELIDHHLVLAALEMFTTEIGMDEAVLLSSDRDGILIYRGQAQKDFSQLAQRYGPAHYNAAYALGLRYSYICLWNHGLAREYRKETQLSSNNPLACECFASAFNHYFDKYHSAFPDLEVFFGSRGCFFKANWEEDPPDMHYFICPPFDETLMQLCADRVLSVLRHRLVPRAHFSFTVPGGWTNFEALEQLKVSPWTTRITDFAKGQLPFIDYMSQKKNHIVYPTDICEVVLSNSIVYNTRGNCEVALR